MLSDQIMLQAIKWDQLVLPAHTRIVQCLSTYGCCTACTNRIMKFVLSCLSFVAEEVVCKIDMEYQLYLGAQLYIALYHTCYALLYYTNNNNNLQCTSSFVSVCIPFSNSFNSLITNVN